MKKLIVSTLLGISLITTGTSLSEVQAATINTNEAKTILVAADKYGNNKRYRVYKLHHKKMVATKKSIKTYTPKRLKYWHAYEVKVNGQKWWKIGKNQYFKNSRVRSINTDFMKKHGQTYNNYAN